ncbi:orotate phosphoribosyltransferase [Porphyromonas levii]|uniref:orotate phosphoribosyltransferase n=1 Tax=Porphyromonas levii TaxID=28114 RepID=UPI00201264E5|nr:orotate phosphoribosyltransferase [Porphyromonas levii]MBR8730868.1 Orotate phosphoribosyltransferase [Porphyromonas levii]MBR8765187.1 Orotate phosphoribosyltransferase [Porphyromonas levii]MBR8801790.1 Orotate phosphoribosyltransferase [Porphyromonas levii]
MSEIAKKTAEHLLRLEAVKLSPKAPFTWASGWKSPIYCDNRVTLSDAEARTFIKESLAETIKAHFPGVTAISGVATGAIAQGALVADLMGLPFSYIRSKAKDHGMENLIEGRISPADKVVVVEDLISTGGSSLKAVEALRAHGCEVLGMVAIYTHGIAKSEEAFAEAGVQLYTLSNYDTVVEQAIESGYISADDLEMLREWRKDPANWGK